MARDKRDETATAQPDPAPPPADRAQVVADLEKAKARLGYLMPRVEAEHARRQRFQNRLAQAQMRWRVEHPDEPFEPEAFSPPLVWVVNPDAEPEQREFHKLHYRIAELEASLEALGGLHGPVPTLAASPA